MKRVQAATAIGVGIIIGLIILAAVVRPLLPFLFAALVLACVLRVLFHDS